MSTTQHGLLVGVLGFCCVFCGGPAIWAKYIPVEDFDELVLGPVVNQNEWVAASSTQVVNDPEGGPNQVLAVTEQSTLVRKPIQLADDTVRMFFLRFRFADQLSASFGLSHATAPSEYSDFGPEMNLTNASPDLRIADGATTGIYETLTSLNADTWYNAWLLVNNATNTTQVWLNDMPGAAAVPGDRLSNGDGLDEFGFRVGGSRDLVNFYIKTSSGGAGDFGPLYLDDLAIEDASALNLSNPAPPLPGDYDLNGRVDGLDYQVWLDDFGSLGGSNADGNADGVVDAADYNVWRDHQTAASEMAVIGVPEPSSFWLVGLFAFLLAALALHGRRFATSSVIPAGLPGQRQVGSLVVLGVLAWSSGAQALEISHSATPPVGEDLLIGFDTDAVGGQKFFTMARGGGSSGVGGGESAFGQTFRFDLPTRFDQITMKVRLEQDVSQTPLMLWFGRGFTGTTSSGMSYLIVNEEADLPNGLNGIGDIWYLTLDFPDQVLTPGITYAYEPRFAAGGAGDHPEMEVGFMGSAPYPGGKPFDIDYDTIFNNELVFFLHGQTLVDVLGDYNRDGTVNNVDYGVWQGTFGQEVDRYSDADGNGDGIVNAPDFTIWRDAVVPMEPSVSAVPEPGCFLVLAGLAGAILLARRAA